METYDPFNTLTLTFPGSRYDGVSVRCRLDMTYDEYEAVRTALFAPDEKGMVDPRKQYQIFAEKVLVEWNLIDPKTKKSIPISQAASKAPALLMRECIDAWAAKFWDVDAPLGGA